MTTEVETPDGSIAEFPDGMSKEDIQGVLAKQFPAPQPTPQVAAPGGVMGTLGNVGRGIYQGIPFGNRAVAAVESIPHGLGLGGPGYEENLARWNAGNEAVQHSPAANFGRGVGNLATAIGASALGPEMAGAGLAAKMANAGAMGSAIGGATGAANSPDLTNVPQTLGNAATEGYKGAALGGGLSLAGGLAGKVADLPAVKTLGDEFTRKLTNQGNYALGNNASPSTLSAAQDAITENMRKVASRNTLMPDEQLMNEVRQAVGSQATPNPAVQKMADTVADWKTPAGPQVGAATTEAKPPTDLVPGQTVADLRSEATKRANSSSLTDPDTANAYRSIRGALDAGMERSIAANNPSDVGVLPALRNDYGMWRDISKAASKPAAGADQSVVTPQRMQAVLSAGNRSYDYAQGKGGPLADVTREAMANVQPSSERSSLADALSGVLSHHAGSTLGRAAVGGAVGSSAGLPGALAGALGGAAVPWLQSGIQGGRQWLGSTPFVMNRAAELAQPSAQAYTNRLNPLLVQQLLQQLQGQTNAP